MGRNGYNDSLFRDNEDGRCIICGRIGDTARHEIFHGPNRQNSKRLGAWVSVCPDCHRRIHAGDNSDYLWLKQDAQRLLEKEMGYFGYMAWLGRNYLDPCEWVDIGREEPKRGL